MARIMVVDDEKAITDSIAFALRKEGYSVHVLHDGLSAWDGLHSLTPDLIVLDIMMPRMDGLELCRKMRGNDIQVPIIFLSSRDEEIDRIMGLETGGDDYLSKPFSIRELSARIRAVLKRTASAYGAPAHGDPTYNDPADINSAAASDRGILQSGRITIDFNRAAISIDGQTERVTLTELRILSALMRNCGTILNRDQLMMAAFPDDSYPNPRAADSHIKRLRKKISEMKSGLDPIETVYGMGYRFICDQENT